MKVLKDKKLAKEDKFLVRTVIALSGYLLNKILMFQEFGHMIDTGLNLRGIIDGAEFIDNVTTS